MSPILNRFARLSRLLPAAAAALPLAVACAPAVSSDDAGIRDAGVAADAGAADAGMDEVDAGTPADAGMTDAGAADAGAPDAGKMDGGMEADGGVTGECVLGTGLGSLALLDGYAVASELPLDQNDGFIAFAELADGSLFGVTGSDGRIYDMGSFDAPLAMPAAVADVKPQDSDAMMFVSSYLASNGVDKVAAGYTASGVGFPGEVVEYTVGGSVRRLDAPGNYAADYAPSGLMVNGLGLNGVANDASGTALPSVFGDMMSTAAILFMDIGDANGPLVMAGDTVVVGGYSFDALANELHALPTGDLDIMISLAEATPTATLNALATTSAFGGVAAVETNASFETLGVTWRGVNDTGDGLEASVMLVDVVDSACTNVVGVGESPDGVLVLVLDDAGTRLLKIVPLT